MSSFHLPIIFGSSNFAVLVVIFILSSLSIPDRPVGGAVTLSFLSRRSEVQISGRSNRTQCCQWIATAVPFFPKRAVFPVGAMTRK